MRIILAILFTVAINASIHSHRVNKQLSIKCGLQIGDKITLAGELLPKAKIISIGVINGKLKSSNAVIPFYLSVNFRQNKLRLNDFTRKMFGRKWGDADMFENPFKNSKTFKISIIVDSKRRYVIFTNDVLLTKFSRTPIAKGNQITVVGDFKMTEFNVESECVDKSDLVTTTTEGTPTTEPNISKNETFTTTTEPTTTVFIEEAVAMFENAEFTSEADFSANCDIKNNEQ